MKRLLARVAWLAVLLCSLATALYAQGVQTGTLRGTITDPQGSAVPGATVTITSPALQGQRSTTSDATGAYSFVALPPGQYTVKADMQSFASIERTITVPLGISVEENISLRLAAVTEQVLIVGTAPAPIVTPIVGANYKHDEISALATPRTLQGIAQLAPGLTENTPNGGQVTINGAFAFDNVFMLNGVDVNDNLFGSPQNLFIEDAIEETQVLTSGITAEYGRFTGGVVNAITKSGGNIFSGSFRTNLSSPSWTEETPFEKCDPAVTASTCRPAPERKKDLQAIYEATLGGPIIKDRLWFFGATRYAKTDTVGTLPQTNTPNTRTETNKRGEIKATASAASSHTFQGGYLNNSTEQGSRPTFDFTIDKFGIGNRTLPNWYAFANYRGVLRSNLAAELQFSNRRFQFKNSGSSLTDLVDSPFITLNQALGHYNAQYFDAADPEERNNYQFTGNVSYLTTGAAGRHEIKAGYEFFRSQRTGGNSQSATGFVFDADYATDASGSSLFDASGHLIPVFVPGETLIENWLPVRGAVLNVDNNSAFAQDHWVINRSWSADVGVRFERVRSEATGGILGLDANNVVPRLAAAYDIGGNGRHVIHATYGWYSGRANEAQIGGNNNVGTPDLLLGVYTGPAGQGRNFAPGFNTANYTTVLGQFPTANVFLGDSLRTPVVKEFTASFGTQFMGNRGWAEGTYVHRDTDDLIEDFISLANGTTDVVKNGVDAGTFTNVVYDNSDIAFRQYDGLLFQSRYSLTNRWTVNGHYTVQLKNDGNYEGEGANQPGLVGRIGDYPEIFTAARHFPEGRTDDFQRHKLRVWSIYNFGMGRFGNGTASAIWRVDSGQRFSFAATGQPLTSIQNALLARAGYPDAPSSQNVFFGDRGAGKFEGYGLLDLSATYDVPVFRTLRPWIKFDAFNALNNQKLIKWDVRVNQDASSPKDALGLATNFTQRSTFGKANSNTQFPVPFGGLTGGRTLRLAVGFRF